MSIESVMPSNRLILCYPLLLLPSIFPGIRVFSNESDLRIRWPKYWSFGFSSPYNEYPDWFPLELTGLISLQYKGLSRVFSNTTVQRHQSVLSFLYSLTLTSIQDTGKTTALTRWTFVGKVMPVFFNMLPSFVIAFLPRAMHLLILWLKSPSAVIFEPRKMKSVRASFVSPSICH